MELKWKGKRRQASRVNSALKLNCEECLGQDFGSEIQAGSGVKSPNYNSVFHCENLDYLQFQSRKDDTEKFDFIYLDPPFYSGHDYHFASVSDDRSFVAFEDNWKSLDDYLDFLYRRLLLCHSLLYESGALFLHLDPSVACYGRIIVEEIFSRQNVINDIVWSYKTGGVPKLGFSRKHDSIIYAVKSRANCVWNASTQESEASHNYGFEHSERIRQRDVLRISAVPTKSDPNLNYPTQKPIALLAKLIECTTKPGDRVLDLFGGSGTTAIAASQLNRQWTIIDQQDWAIETTIQRLRDLKIPYRLFSCDGHKAAKISYQEHKTTEFRQVVFKDFWPLRTKRKIAGLGRGLKSLASWSLLKNHKGFWTVIDGQCRDAKTKRLVLRTKAFAQAENDQWAIKTVDLLGRRQFLVIT